MKKFTKFCLITALIIFITGCAFCTIFGALGGFRQLDSMQSNWPYKILKFGKLGNYGLGYNGIWFGIWEEDDWDEEGWTEMYEISNTNNVSDTDNASISSAAKTNYSASDIHDIDIEVGGEKLTIAESDNEYIYVGGSSVNKIKYGVEGGTFKLKSKQGFKLWKRISAGNVYLYLPKGMKLNSIDLEVAAGKMESISLEADEINMDIGAGIFNIESIIAHEIDIEVGAGEVNINNISSDEASISVGAGSLSIQGMDIRNVSMEAGMGNIYAEGRITGDADIEAGMGNISMALNGNEADYNYHVECAMGNISIGSNRYSGIASERHIDNGSNQNFNVECSMGSIDIGFN